MKALTKLLFYALACCSLAIIMLFLTAQNAYAAVPPDACFDFDSGTGTVLGYYDNENGNPGDPACTKEVDIPTTIGGTSVTTLAYSAFQGMDLTAISIPNSVVSIGNSVFRDNLLTTVTIPSSITAISDGAFLENQLTSVTMPNSITTIGNDAFGGNQLTAITIPDSVTTIGERAFMINNLTSVTIPDSVTLIDVMAFGANHLESVAVPASLSNLSPFAFIFQTIAGGTSYQQYADAYNTGDPEIILPAAEQFMRSLIYTAVFTADPENPQGLTDGLMTEVDFGDIDGDGDQDSSVGGHIINPASVTIRYINNSGGEIQGAQTFTGSSLFNYRAFENITNDLSLYYRIGDIEVLTPPAIDSYIVPAARSFTFASAANDLTFVYTPLDTTASTNSSADGGLAATGLPQPPLLVTAVLWIAGAAFLLKRSRATDL